MAAEVAFTLTEQDYADSARNEYWHRVKSPRRWAWMILGLSAVFCVFAYSDSNDLLSFLYNLIPYFVILFVVCPLLSALIYFSAGRRARRMFRQQTFKSENRMSWDDEGLKVHSGLGSMSATWADFYGWRKSGHTYTFYMNEALYYLLPGRALSSEQAADLESTLARHEVVRR